VSVLHDGPRDCTTVASETISPIEYSQDPRGCGNANAMVGSRLRVGNGDPCRVRSRCYRLVDESNLDDERKRIYLCRRGIWERRFYVDLWGGGRSSQEKVCHSLSTRFKSTSIVSSFTGITYPLESG